MVRAKVREPSTRLIRTLRAHHSRQKLARWAETQGGKLKPHTHVAYSRTQHGRRQSAMRRRPSYRMERSAEKRRTLFLDLDQRRNLLAHCGKGSFQSGWLAVA